MVELRDRWQSRGSFLLGAIGSAVGLGNLWRFPYVAYKNGGGAFLVPYFVALLTAGIPLLILEYSLGAKMQGSAPKALGKVRSKWEFVGWWALVVGMIISMYYVSIMGMSWDYLFSSFKSVMPWGTSAETAEKFFNEKVLNLSSGPFDIKDIAWGVFIGAIITWVWIFLVIFKGVKNVGRVVLITVPLPWLMLVVLTIRGLTLEGASTGINYYLAPQWEKLFDPSAWLAAYGQIFFSLSLGFGIMIAYASYMSKTSDTTNNAFITAFANSGTEYLAGFSVFSILGYFAVSINADVASVVKGGPGLAFVVYPAALAKLGDIAGWMAPFFSICFFITLITLGIDSAFSIVEAFAAGLEDKFGWGKTKTSAILCVLGLLGSLWFSTTAGLYWLDITDHWISDCFGLAIIGLLECILIGWLWKASKFRQEINSFSDIRIGRWWDICIKFITPAVLIWLLITNIWELIEKPYGGYCSLALFLGGWMVALMAPVIGIILTIIKPKNPRWKMEEG
ncbi:MAG: sodium-dependent transporter [Planctomycetota bacterium]|nr:sodium-dependent transporter [Planctomycetota bacterium]